MLARLHRCTSGTCMRLVAALCLLSMAAVADAAANSVCFEGYIMDTYCIRLGNLLDMPSLATLEKPDQHSIHCLVDVAQCRALGYEVLGDPAPGKTLYTRAYALDENGNTLAIAAARAAGARGRCSTCTAGGGSQVMGFRATVVGTDITGNSDVRPRKLAVTQVLAPNSTCPDGSQPTKACTDCSSDGHGHQKSAMVAHGILMMTSWGFMLPCGALSARLLKHRPNALWFRIHRPMQIAGLVVATCGFIVAITFFRVFEGDFSTSTLHGTLGIIVMTLGLGQPLNAFFRPHPKPRTRARERWEYLHKGAGWTAVTLAVVTVGLGTTLTAGNRPIFMGLYGFVLVVLIAGVLLAKQDARAMSSSKAETETPKDAAVVNTVVELKKEASSR